MSIFFDNWEEAWSAVWKTIWKYLPSAQESAASDATGLEVEVVVDNPISLLPDATEFAMTALPSATPNINSC